jgi:hypothetical protein
MTPLYMHQTTYDYLKRNYLNIKTNTTMYFSQDISFDGFEIVINNIFSPTIDEPEDWIFPNEPFIKYEQKDKEWCKYFKIGRQGRGFILGEIMQLTGPLFNLEISPPKKKARIFDPFKSWS